MRRGLCLMNQPQDRIATAVQAQFTAHIGSYLSADGESKSTERLLQSCGALCMRTAERGKTFCKDLLCTGALLAKETTDVHDETDGMSN